MHAKFFFFFFLSIAAAAAAATRARCARKTYSARAKLWIPFSAALHEVYFSRSPFILEYIPYGNSLRPPRYTASANARAQKRGHPRPSLRISSSRAKERTDANRETHYTAVENLFSHTSRGKPSALRLGTTQTQHSTTLNTSLSHAHTHTHTGRADAKRSRVPPAVIRYIYARLPARNNMPAR